MGIPGLVAVGNIVSIHDPLTVHIFVITAALNRRGLNVIKELSVHTVDLSSVRIKAERYVAVIRSIYFYRGPVVKARSGRILSRGQCLSVKVEVLTLIYLRPQIPCSVSPPVKYVVPVNVHTPRHEGLVVVRLLNTLIVARRLIEPAVYPPVRKTVGVRVLLQGVGLRGSSVRIRVIQKLWIEGAVGYAPRYPLKPASSRPHISTRTPDKFFCQAKLYPISQTVPIAVPEHTAGTVYLLHVVVQTVVIRIRVQGELDSVGLLKVLHTIPISITFVGHKPPLLYHHIIKAPKPEIVYALPALGETIVVRYIKTALSTPLKVQPNMESVGSARGQRVLGTPHYLGLKAHLVLRILLIRAAYEIDLRQHNIQIPASRKRLQLTPIVLIHLDDKCILHDILKIAAHPRSIHLTAEMNAHRRYLPEGYITPVTRGHREEAR